MKKIATEKQKRKHTNAEGNRCDGTMFPNQSAWDNWKLLNVVPGSDDAVQDLVRGVNHYRKNLQNQRYRGRLPQKVKTVQRHSRLLREIGKALQRTRT